MKSVCVSLALLLLSCTPPEIPLGGPISGTATSSDGVSIAYEVQGEGEPALVFIHGWAGYRQEWAPQMAHFSSSHKVVAIDLAGHGESGDNRAAWTMKAFGEDVAAVARQLELTNAVLIGHSMGTPVILEAALQMPNEVVALVPVDVLKNVERTYSQDRIDAMAENYMAGMANPSHESLGGWFTAKMDSAVINSYVRYCQDSAEQHWTAWEQSLREVFAWFSTDQLRVLSEIDAPVICINSARPTTDLEMARKYVSSFDVREIEDVGHSIHWEVPDQFNQVLEEILATLEQ